MEQIAEGTCRTMESCGSSECDCACGQGMIKISEDVRENEMPISDECVVYERHVSTRFVCVFCGSRRLIVA